MEKIFYNHDLEGSVSLIRLYNDGLVLGVGVSIEKDQDMSIILKWFNRESGNIYLSKGAYTTNGNEISFDLTSGMGTVNYKGRVLSSNELILETYSLINGYKATKRYKLLTGNRVEKTTNIESKIGSKSGLKEDFKYFLFFDTETNGLPKNYNSPVTEIDNWPRIVQLAYLLYDSEGNKLLSGDFIIKPSNYTIPSSASNIHGITTEKAEKVGLEIKQVLSIFQSIMDKSDCLVAHNMNFDQKVIGAEFIRNGMYNLIDEKAKICTMELSTDFCAIPGYNGYKWPKLSELHNKLFQTSFKEAHNASVDITATAKCFWKLKELNQI